MNVPEKHRALIRGFVDADCRALDAHRDGVKQNRTADKREEALAIALIEEARLGARNDDDLIAEVEG